MTKYPQTRRSEPMQPSIVTTSFAICNRHNLILFLKDLPTRLLATLRRSLDVALLFVRGRTLGRARARMTTLNDMQEPYFAIPFAFCPEISLMQLKMKSTLALLYHIKKYAKRIQFLLCFYSFFFCDVEKSSTSTYSFYFCNIFLFYFF